MEEEDEDDIYAPDESRIPEQNVPSDNGDRTAGARPVEEDEEEGEEVEEDESDSDIDIIIESKSNVKDGKPRVTESNNAAVKRQLSEHIVAGNRSPIIKNETQEKQIPVRPGTSYPALKTSTLDIDAKPTYEPSGKPITEIDMDADFPEDDKPWRRPGTDMTDYFNYGFDEFTWASYCLKQTALRKEASDSKKQMEDMQNFLNMPGGMPPIPGMTGPSPSGMPSIGGAADIPPEMQQMMTQMMAQGMDPTQMDPATFMQMMQGNQGGAGGDPNQNFGGQGYGQQAQNLQQMNYGYGNGGGGQGRNQGGRSQRGRW